MILIRFSEMRFDREHAGLEDVAARPFQQAGIALLAQDRLVDLAGPLLLDDVGLDQLVADPHAEAADRGVLRQREMEHAFQPAVGVVDERFLDRRAGDLVADVDGDLVIADRQRHVAAVGQLGDQRAERFVARRPFKAGQPAAAACATSTSFSSRSTRTSCLPAAVNLRLPVRGASSSNDNALVLSFFPYRRLRQIHLHFARVQPGLRRRDALQQRARAERQFDVRRQPRP